jgi:glycosyltransferase involved in cell wall biosynthesis
MSKKRIIWVITGSFGRGGAERQAIEAGKFLLQQGQEVKFIVLAKATDEYPMPPDAVRFQLNMTGGDLPANIFRLVKHAVTSPPKAVVSFGLPANFAGRFIKIFVPSVRLITSIRTQKVQGIRRRLVRFGRRWDKWTVYNSRTVADLHVKDGIADPKRVKVVFNAVSMPPADPAAREKIRASLGLQQGDFLWGTIGRMEAVKDHLMLINSGVDTWLKKSKLVIVGHGPLAEEIAQLVKRLGLEERVLLPGRQSNISDWCSAMDAFVLSSKWEGMPNGLLEAMNCGLPCVSTQVGGVAEVLENGKNGLMVPPQDPEAISKAMETMLAMGLPERDNLATRGQTFIVKHCAPGVIAKQWCSLILGEDEPASS